MKRILIFIVAIMLCLIEAANAADGNSLLGRRGTSQQMGILIIGPDAHLYQSKDFYNYAREIISSEGESVPSVEIGTAVLDNYRKYCMENGIGDHSTESLSGFASKYYGRVLCLFVKESEEMFLRKYSNSVPDEAARAVVQVSAFLSDGSGIIGTGGSVRSNTSVRNATGQDPVDIRARKRAFKKCTADIKKAIFDKEPTKKETKKPVAVVILGNPLWKDRDFYGYIKDFLKVADPSKYSLKAGIDVQGEYLGYLASEGLTDEPEAISVELMTGFASRYGYERAVFLLPGKGSVISHIERDPINEYEYKPPKKTYSNKYIQKFAEHIEKKFAKKYPHYNDYVNSKFEVNDKEIIRMDGDVTAILCDKDKVLDTYTAYAHDAKINEIPPGSTGSGDTHGIKERVFRDCVRVIGKEWKEKL